MKASMQAWLGASFLALTGLLGWDAGSAQAQVGYYAVPSTVYPRYYSYSVPYSVPVQRYVYVRPVARPAPPNPGIGGNGYHYGYFPARRELPLYKPWLRRD
jgi:hypothetical protein